MKSIDISSINGLISIISKAITVKTLPGTQLNYVKCLLNRVYLSFLAR